MVDCVSDWYCSSLENGQGIVTRSKIEGSTPTTTSVTTSTSTTPKTSIASVDSGNNQPSKTPTLPASSASS